MTKILHIDASGRKEGSTSRALGQKLVEKLGGGATHRDISQGMSFVDDTTIGAYFTPAEQRNDAQKQAIALSEELVQELFDHDTYVIGIPMYNFTIPASFKAWADLVARAGLTFKYGDDGAPIGLLKNKKAYVVIATGGVPVGSDMDFLKPWLTFFLGFIGITDIEFITADGTMSRIDEVMNKAHAQIDALAA